MGTRRTTILPEPRPSKVERVFYLEETENAALFPRKSAGASERRQSAGKLLGRLCGLRVNLESLPLRVIEGGELFYRIVLENATGGELREIRLMETWITDGPTTSIEHRTIPLPPLEPHARYLLERRASFRAGLLSIVAAASASPSAAGVLLASDRRKRLVIRQGTEARHGYRTAA